MPGPRLHAYHEDFAYYEERALGLLASAQDGNASAVDAFAVVGAPIDAGGARTVVAADHGLPSWEDLRRHVAGLREAGEPFALAYRAIEARDPDSLRELLAGHPELVTAQGTNGNDLLGMAGATGDHRLSMLLLDPAPIPAAPTCTAGPRCTRPLTATIRSWRGGCCPPAHKSTAAPAATVARR